MNYTRVLLRSLPALMWGAFGIAYACGFGFWGMPGLHITAGISAVFLAVLLVLGECKDEIERFMRVEHGLFRGWRRIKESDGPDIPTVF